MKTTIIGGGIIGLCTAYFLSKAGVEVEVIDKSDMSDGCSFGNAGMIVPSHFIPLASPGVIAKGLRWMFFPKSPFYIKPRLSLSLMQWLWAFHRSCSKEKVALAIPLLRDFHALSKQLYREMAADPELDFHYKEAGILVLFRTANAQWEETEIAAMANEIGVEARVMNGAEVAALDPGTTTDVSGGVYYPGDAHLFPNKLMESLKSYLKKHGVNFLDKTTIIGFRHQNDVIDAILTDKNEEIKVENLVVASGAWSARILKMLGVKMLLQDGKGYSFTMKNVAKNITIPSLLTEHKIAMTPMGTNLRIGGTLEISNLSSAINLQRVEGIAQAIPKYYPELHFETPPQSSIWHGFRPCSPDGLPYIGRSMKYKNLVVATGHSMMGISLGPATGMLVGQLLQQQKPTLDLTLLEPDRF